ncbi:MAG TPA: amidohydrolase family protein [Acidimicrobiales bacterium]|jgi:N-acyl-D-aspartate/D-glutamate deacylase|nr:amidohydrolase family protein [Acidimicrobiales bacterium]
MYDVIIRDGLVVDGTGLPARNADVGINEGRITAVGRLRGEQAATVIDAAGAVVAPGIVDAHTHYDPQVTWDPMCDTSALHGVTTVVSGNCGFSLAPCRAEDRAYLAQVFARVEGMDLSALSHVDWRFESFPEFLGSLDGRLGLNMGAYVGHSAVRRYVMGEASHERAATDVERDRIVALVDEAMAAGAMGWSSSHAPVHLDLADRPVPSRLADLDELRALADVVGRAGRGSIAYAPQSSVEGIGPADRDLLIELAARGGVPVITQGLGGRNKVDAPDLAWADAAKFLDRSTSNGTPVYCLLMTRGFNGPFTLAHGTTRYEGVSLWHELFSLPLDARRARIADPDRRAAYRHAVDHYNTDPNAGSTLPPPVWDLMVIDEVRADANRSYVGRTVGEIARDEGRHPTDVMFDIALADDLLTVFHWNSESPQWREIMRVAQRHPNMILGVSDGGAHLDRDDGAAWSTHFLERWWRAEGLWRLEEAIRLITAIPARVCGIADRGVLAPGWHADVMVFDPDALRAEDSRLETDVATGVPRFRNIPRGFAATVVNGVPVVLDGAVTGALPGQVVRPA